MRGKRIRRIVPLVTLIFLLSSAAQTEDWPKYRRDALNSGHSAERGTLANGVKTVNSANIQSLSLKWSKESTGRLVEVRPSLAACFLWVHGTESFTVFALQTAAPPPRCRLPLRPRMVGQPCVAAPVPSSPNWRSNTRAFHTRAFCRSSRYGLNPSSLLGRAARSQQ